MELGELVFSFNVMLEKLEENFRRLSHFTANIAHELRTPITNLTTQIQVVLSMPRRAGQYQDILYSNLEELERMGKMVADMLFLTQADESLIKPESTAEHRALIFERFYRIDPARRRSSEGGGLGLAIVKSIAQAHGGDVVVTSAAGKTLFTVTLPHVQTRNPARAR